MLGKKYVFNLFELKILEIYFEEFVKDFLKVIGFFINFERCFFFEE